MKNYLEVKCPFLSVKISYFLTVLQRKLLKHTLKVLTETAKEPLPEMLSDKHDLPQAHALNILQSLFRSSVTSEDVSPYISDVLQLTISGFSSSCFVVRNSSMQLFSKFWSWKYLNFSMKLLKVINLGWTGFFCCANLSCSCKPDFPQRYNCLWEKFAVQCELTQKFQADENWTSMK